MATFGERVRTARKAKGLTQKQFGDACGGWSQSRVWNYENGVSEPDNATITIMANVLDVSESWLAFGRHTVEEDHAPYNVDDRKYAFIPVYNAAAGAGRASNNGHTEIAGTFAYRRDWLESQGLVAGALAVIKADGDSMHPTIFDGDTILVNMAQKAVQSGKVYAFQTSEGVRIKRLFRQMDGRIRVASDNPDKITYPDEYLTPDHPAEIIGQVVHRSGGV